MVGYKNIEEVLAKFSSLNYDNERQVFFGRLCIREDDSYNIEIDISSFPEKFPRVHELNGRIPPKMDRHVNSDGSLCFTTAANESLYLKTRINTLSQFIEHILIPYLQNNSYYEYTGKYKFGEYNHDILIATYETYIDLLNIDNIYLLIVVLRDRINHKKYRPNDICYCNSGKKIKKCQNHEVKYGQFKKVDVNIIKVDLAKMYFLYQEFINSPSGLSLGFT